MSQLTSTKVLAYITSAVSLQYGFMCLERSLTIHPRFSLVNLSLVTSILTKKYRQIVIIVSIGSMEKTVD